MKIAILAPYTRPWDIGESEGSGMNDFVRWSATALADAGHSVTVYTRASRNEDVSRKTISKNLSVRCIGAGERIRLGREDVYRACRDSNFPTDELHDCDTVIAHYWIAQAWVEKITPLYKKKILYFSHSSFFNPQRTSYNALQAFAETWMMYNAVWCAYSRSEYDILKKILGERVVLVSAGVDGFSVPGHVDTQEFTWKEHVACIERIVLSPERIYSGAVLNVERVPRIINNQLLYFERVLFAGSVHVIPVDANGRMVFVRERRMEKKLHGEYRVRVLSGIMNEGEMPVDAAKRELEEELGLRAEKFELFMTFKKDGSIQDKRYYFLAHSLSKGSVNRDATEDIDGHVTMSKEQVCEAVISGFFGTGETAVAILKLCGILKIR